MFIRVNQQIALQVSNQIQGQSHQTLLNQLALLVNMIREGKAGRQMQLLLAVSDSSLLLQSKRCERLEVRNLLSHLQFDFLSALVYLCNGIAQLCQLYIQLHPLKQISQA